MFKIRGKIFEKIAKGEIKGKRAEVLITTGEDIGEAANAMGYWGARWAYAFVHNGFGLASYSILPFLVLTGLYWLLDYRPFSLLRILIHTMLFMLWFSLFLGFVYILLSRFVNKY